MRLCFICSTVEPGHHGIGDYTIKLASQCIRQGHNVSILAIQDPYIQSELATCEIGNGIFNRILRIPSCYDQNQRLNIAKDFLGSNDPEWLIFQSCLFSYHRKGLPFGLVKLLAKFSGKGRKWHIMFHEIWLGEFPYDSLKTRLLGELQKIIIKRLIKVLKPVSVSTSTEFFLESLLKEGISAIKIPIFSNIPTGEFNDLSLLSLLPRDVLNNRNDYVIGTFFGNVYYTANLYTKVNHLAQMIGKTGKTLFITHIGGGTGVESFFSELKKYNNLNSFIFGKRNDQQIANFFLQVDIGLSTYPKILFEKSGSIAAMINNNLPVILLRESGIKDSRQLEGISELEGLENIGSFIRPVSDLNTKVNVEKVSVKLLSSLNQFECEDRIISYEL